MGLGREERKAEMAYVWGSGQEGERALCDSLSWLCQVETSREEEGEGDEQAQARGGECVRLVTV